MDCRTRRRGTTNHGGRALLIKTHRNAEMRGDLALIFPQLYVSVEEVTRPESNWHVVSCQTQVAPYISESVCI